ncbi:hypothetical protein EDB19DRAFT_1948270 [Suillus lakei]|nr:hypothetical protein EDB19DRAFT_1948270 [Suillus lakei]
MSTSVDTSFTSLKATTAQIMAIISGAWQIPLGPNHYSLTQISALVSQAVWEYGTGPHIPGIVLSCLKELIQVRSMTPQVWPNWYSNGYDDLCLLKHSWPSKIVAWQVLGDHTFDLPVAAPPLVGLIPVDLPSPPIITGNVASLSTNTTTKSWDRGKSKAIVADLEPEVVLVFIPLLNKAPSQQSPLTTKPPSTKLPLNKALSQQSLSQQSSLSTKPSHNKASLNQAPSQQCPLALLNNAPP